MLRVCIRWMEYESGESREKAGAEKRRRGGNMMNFHFYRSPIAYGNCSQYLPPKVISLYNMGRHYLVDLLRSSSFRTMMIMVTSRKGLLI